MIRLLLVVVLPLLAPFIVYAIVVWLNRRSAASGPAGGQASPGQGTPPWLWLLLAGVVCSAIALYLLGPDRGVPPGTKLLPPAVVDGEVIPSRPAEQ